MADKKVHFPGTGKCKFHAARNGQCDLGSGGRPAQDAATNQEATSGGGCDYAALTNETGRAEKQYRNMRAHHLLPLTVYKRYKSDGAYVTFVRNISAALNGTSYCANQSLNMKWLPLKTTYRKKRVNLSSPVWDLDLPCHDIDHDGKDQGYTYDVTQDFKKIWDEIKSGQQQTPKKCMTPDEVVTALRNLETKYRGYLDTLSASRGGTRKAIDLEAKARKAGNNSHMAAFWWLPFSMASRAVAMTRPIFRFGERPVST